MQNNYWETASSFCCPECGHLFLDSVDDCPFCDGHQNCGHRYVKSLSQIKSSIMFDDERYLLEINFDDSL